jgi:hypothetical protein
MLRLQASDMYYHTRMFSFFIKKIFLFVLGFELTALHLLGRCSTT